MKIIMALKTGASRVLSGWKNALVAWFVIMLLTAAVISPFKGALSSAFGSSMITEKLADGFSVEVFTDLDQVYQSLLSAFGKELLLLILISFVLNAFFTGGFFDFARTGNEGHTVGDFMKGCVRNFWSFVIILVITCLMIFLIIMILSFVPMIFIDMEGDHVEMMIFRTALISLITFLLILPVLLLVADYARAWKAANSSSGVFSAIAKGFSLTFSNFLSSWALMFIILIVNALYLWLVMSVLSWMKPHTGPGIFLFFLLSQAMFIIRIAIKWLRYSGVTGMMELNAGRQLSPEI